MAFLTSADHLGVILGAGRRAAPPPCGRADVAGSQKGLARPPASL